jgi:LDH2 family malate/lactate/ureidoglycolate dehydrogenase
VIRLSYEDLVDFVTEVFAHRGVPAARASVAATALCYGDLAGLSSHGLANLTRLYLPLFDRARVDPAAEPSVVTDTGPCVLWDAHRALGLWAASAAMDLAVTRAGRYGVGVVSVRSGTHFGCAGVHTRRAAAHGMVGVLAANCGRQRIARPPEGRLAMLGTNPLSVAAPAGALPPFVLDMSTTAVPTGRIRLAARRDQEIPPGWLADESGRPVTDPAAFDRGDAHLQWLGGASETGGYKGFGLGLMVEVLAALLPGAGLGPEPDALLGDGGPSGQDDDIGFLAMAFAPAVLRPGADFARDAERMFATLLACPPAQPGGTTRYPGCIEDERMRENLSDGVPLDDALYDELCAVSRSTGVRLADVGARA